MFRKSLCIALVIPALWSCSQGSHKVLDTPTSGSIAIAVDESFQPVIESEVEVFEALYPEAHINAHYLPEGNAFAELLKDSVRIVIATRDLNEEEKKVFQKVNITPHLTKIATDALALVLNPANKDTAFTVGMLKKIFTGAVNSWQQINPHSRLDQMQIVFDNQNSSTSRYATEKLAGGKLPANCFAAKGNKEVIDYVAKTPSAIGIIGVNWISDRDDSTSLSFLSKVKVASISEYDFSKEASDFYQPYQAYIARKNYPLTRSLYIVSREARDGLGTGFSAFVAGDKGQRIILKSALMPASAPVRIVNIH